MNKIFTDAHEWSGYFYGHSRDLTVEDFEFKEARVSGAHSIYGDRPPKSATANIAFYLKEELVAELEEATGNRRDGVRNHFMHFSDRKMFYVAINIDIKYNGCRSQGTKITKFLKVCSELEGQWKESADGLVSERVAEINKSWQETLERARGEYVGQYAAHLSKCDSYAMDVLDDEAGNLENLKKLEDLRKEVQTLNKEIHRARYRVLFLSFDTPSDDLKDGDWIKDLPTELRTRVAEKLKENVEDPPLTFRGIIG